MTEHDSKMDKPGKKNQLVEGMRKSKGTGANPSSSANPGSRANPGSGSSSGQQTLQPTFRKDRTPSRPGSSSEGGGDAYSTGRLRWPDCSSLFCVSCCVLFVWCFFVFVCSL